MSSTRDLALVTPEQGTASSSTPEPPPGAEPLTDYGNSLRLVRRWGADLRYSRSYGWCAWEDGAGVWRTDAESAVIQLAAETIRAAYGEAAALLQTASESGEKADAKAARDLVQHALRSESAVKLGAMVRLAATHPALAEPPARWDMDPWLLVVENGTVDLRTGGLRESRREDFNTKRAAVRFDLTARCPKWEQHLARVLPDAEERALLQRWLGYCLTGLTAEQVATFWYGQGQNGRSLTLKVLEIILSDYARTADSTLLTERARGQAGAPREDLFRLQGARFIRVNETGEGTRLNDGMFKHVTGTDTVSARTVHGLRSAEFTVTGKFTVVTNHLPRLGSVGPALRRRIRVIPFTVRIPDAERVPFETLVARLLAERSGILNWAVGGCLAWQQRGLGEAAAVRTATSDYLDEEDQLGRWLTACCRDAPDGTTRVAALRASYVRWCEASGEEPVSETKLGRWLTERGYPRTRDRDATRSGLVLTEATS